MPPKQQQPYQERRSMQGVLFMILSSLSFSLMFLGVKVYSNAPTFTLVFYRSIAQTIFSGLLLLLEQTAHKRGNLQEAFLGPKQVRGLLVLRGLFGSFAVAAFFHAVQSLPLPDAITIQFTTPVFASVMAVPLLGEPIKQNDIIVRSRIFFIAVILKQKKAVSKNSLFKIQLNINLE